MYKENNDPLYVQETSVWIVDDHPDYREMIQDLVNDTGGMFCMHSFESCEEMFDVLPFIPKPNVILMDIEIPDKMSGIEGVRQLRKLVPDVKIVMLTFHYEDDLIFDAICSGASGYLLKTSSPDKITESILDAEKGGVVMTPSVASRVLLKFREDNTISKDYELTPREIEVLKLLVDGLKKKEISQKLYIEYCTVDTHIQSIYRKLHVNSAIQAVSKAIKENIV